MPENDLEKLVSKCLADFYKRRSDALKNLKLRDILKRKNPYLLRSLGIEEPKPLIESMLDTHLRESDETIFGETVFEAVAQWAARKKGGHKAEAVGIDIVMEDERSITAVAVKSSPHWGSAQAKKRLDDNFRTMRSIRLRNGKNFDAVIGCGSGSRVSRSGGKQFARTLSGKAFWEWLTGDPEFHLKLSRLMEGKAAKARREFDVARAKALAAYQDEFREEFCKEDMSIDWDKVVVFNTEHRKRRSIP
jgi:hypothetical protein